MANSRSNDNTGYFKGYYNQSPGIASVGSYQVSGLPWVTGSQNLETGASNEQRIRFPAVTKEITVRNISSGQANANINVLFSSGKDSGNAGVLDGNHFITLFSPASTTGQVGGMSEITIDAKVKEIFIQANGAAAAFQVYASLTGIDVANMIPLTGSGINIFDPGDGTTP